MHTLKSPENKSFKVSSPTGKPFEIPVDYDAATDVYSNLSKEEMRQYYETNGYVIQRNVIPPELCDAAKASFEKEVKKYKGLIYRQSSRNPERNVFDAHNYMLNAVMNIQDLDERKFTEFRRLGLDILTHPNIRAIVTNLMQEDPVIAQTMFFEGNPVTWPHQDKDYLDSNKPNSMVAAWIAIEDIKPGAGRFYIYPTSQKVNIAKVGGDVNIILDREAYVKLVIETIHEHNFECKAPALKKGDVLFWHGKTIHGSLETTQPEFSRCSFTAHYIPESRSMLQLQVRQKRLNLREVKGMKVNFPKDQNVLSNKLIFLIETSFPMLFQKIKSTAIRFYKKR